MEKARSTFVEWGVTYLFGLELSTPGLSWLALPVISNIDKEVLRLVLTKLSESVVMEAFLMNTALRKASEAKDYIDAVNLKNSLPEDISDQEYEKYEKFEMDAFVAFASIS